MALEILSLGDGGLAGDAKRSQYTHISIDIDIDVDIEIDMYVDLCDCAETFCLARGTAYEQLGVARGALAPWHQTYQVPGSATGTQNRRDSTNGRGGRKDPWVSQAHDSRRIIKNSR